MGSGVLNIMLLVLIVMIGWVIILWRNSQKMHRTIHEVAQQHNLVRYDDRARRLCRALRILNPNLSPGVDFKIRHDSPDEEPYIAEWMTNDPKPSDTDIQVALHEISDIHHDERYAAIRRAEYPSVEEQLEAAYEARQGNMEKQLEIDARIRQVKEKYPKEDDCV